MKKTIIYIFMLFFIGVSGLAFSANILNAQLTVWNMTQKTITLRCEFLQKNVTMYPASPLDIPFDASPAILLTFQQVGKLVRCNIEQTPAWFVYTVKNLSEETVRLSHLSGQPNFYYDPDYQGALTYR